MEQQHDLFNIPVKNIWEKNWRNMPEYNNIEKNPPFITAHINFRSEEDFREFSGLLKKFVYGGENVFYGMQKEKKKYAWFPLLEKPRGWVYRNEEQKKMNPRFPVYIISKGRWKLRSTSKLLEMLNVPYRIVVEPSEYNNYAEFIDEKKILVLPDDFSKQGQGSIPVRNWVWEHSVREGHSHHWILDDNILSIKRFNDNMKVNCETGNPFYIIEDFVLRYKNIALAGMNYTFFCPSCEERVPVHFNTRIYSCILIDNSIPFRWRGRYNEDTDLSLRCLKAGFVTALFYAFLIEKMTTMVCKGGNTDTIYNSGDDRLEFAESLQRQHPDVVKVVWKFDRWHHHVDYKKFSGNKLVKRDDVFVPNVVNDFGMIKVQKE